MKHEMFHGKGLFYFHIYNIYIYMNTHRQNVQTEETLYKNGKYALFALGAILVASLLGVFLTVWFLQLSWNYSLPDLFGIKTIQYGQSFALLVLVNILFGSIGKQCINSLNSFTQMNHHFA